MNNVKKLAMVAMILSLVGIQNSFAYLQDASADYEKSTPVTHEEADSSLEHFKHKIIQKYNELLNRLVSYWGSITPVRRNSIMREYKKIRVALKGISDTVAAPNVDIEKVQAADKDIDGLETRVVKLENDNAAKS